MTFKNHGSSLCEVRKRLKMHAIFVKDFFHLVRDQRFSRWLRTRILHLFSFTIRRLVIFGFFEHMMFWVPFRYFMVLWVEWDKVWFIDGCLCTMDFAVRCICIDIYTFVLHFVLCFLDSHLFLLHIFLGSVVSQFVKF